MPERSESIIIINQMPDRQTLGRFVARCHNYPIEKADVYFDTTEGTFVDRDRLRADIPGVYIDQMPGYELLTDYLRSMTDDRYNIDHPVVFNNETGSFERLS